MKTNQIASQCQMQLDVNYEFYIEFLSIFAADLPWNSEIKAGISNHIVFKKQSTLGTAWGHAHEASRGEAFVPMEGQTRHRGVNRVTLHHVYHNNFNGIHGYMNSLWLFCRTFFTKSPSLENVNQDWANLEASCQKNMSSAFIFLARRNEKARPPCSFQLAWALDIARAGLATRSWKIWSSLCKHSADTCGGKKARTYIWYIWNILHACM